MKKGILFLLLFIFGLAGFSQSKLFYGFRIGVSSADMSGDAVKSLDNVIDVAKDYVSSGGRTGFYTGTYVSLPLGNVITVEPGLYYSQKGYKLKAALNVKGVDILGVNARAQLQLNYLELPVLLKANMGGLQVFAGPQLSYLTNANLKLSAGALGFNILSTKIPVTSYFNHWDVGLSGGIGYQFSNGLNLAASYDYGLSKVDAGKDFDARNRMIKIGIGYNF